MTPFWVFLAISVVVVAVIVVYALWTGISHD